MDYQKELLGSALREEIISLVSKSRTKSQLLFTFDFYLNSGFIDAAKFFLEMLRRTNIDEGLVSIMDGKLTKHRSEPALPLNVPYSVSMQSKIEI